MERWLPSPSSCWHLKFSKRSFLPTWRVHWLLSSDQPDADLVRLPPSTPRPSGNTRGALFDFLLIKSSVLPLHEPCAGPQESQGWCLLHRIADVNIPVSTETLEHCSRMFIIALFLEQGNGNNASAHGKGKGKYTGIHHTKAS